MDSADVIRFGVPAYSTTKIYGPTAVWYCEVIEGRTWKQDCHLIGDGYVKRNGHAACGWHYVDPLGRLKGYLT